MAATKSGITGHGNRGISRYLTGNGSTRQRSDLLRQRFLGSTERDRAVVGSILVKRPGGGLLMKFRRLLHRLAAARAQLRVVTTVEERPERVRRLVIEIGEIMNNFRPSSFGNGLDALTGTMLTAIEATCGRERADEFDLLIAEFSKEVKRFPEGGRVQ